MNIKVKVYDNDCTSPCKNLKCKDDMLKHEYIQDRSKQDKHYRGERDDDRRKDDSDDDRVDRRKDDRDERVDRRKDDREDDHEDDRQDDRRKDDSGDERVDHVAEMQRKYAKLPEIEERDSYGKKIAMSDSKELNLRNLLKEKTSELDNNFKAVKEKQKQNKFLTNVANDYINYYKYILHQKNEQEKALGILSEYIDRMSSDTAMTKTLLQQAKMDQIDILEKIKQVKREADKIAKVVE